MRLLIAAMSRISMWLFLLCVPLGLTLVGAMTYEVVARRVFHSPTLWAQDISYMSYGAMFVLAAPHLLDRHAHIAIDFISAGFSARLRAGINAVFLLAGLAPASGITAYACSLDAIDAFQTGRVEWVSPWAPLMWPFLSALSFGLLVLTFQAIVMGATAAHRSFAPQATNKAQAA